MNIGIIGYGVVGKAVATAFKERSVLHIYDPAHPGDADAFEDSIDAVWSKAAFVFICVPTTQHIAPDTYGGPFGGAILDQCMESLGGQERHAGKTVILTSTTVPSRIMAYQKQWPRMRLVVCPEFLRERTAPEDYLKPRFRILGGLEDDVTAVAKLFSEFSVCAACPTGYCDALGASLIKYMNNALLAAKVSTLNQFHGLWEKSGSDTAWLQLMEALHLDERIGNSHYQIPGPDGDVGWGGKCFPKDVSALLHEAQDAGVSLSVLKEAWKCNLSIRKNIDWLDD